LEQDVNHRTIRDLALVALGRYLRQYLFDTPQIGNLALDAANMVEGKSLYFPTAICTAINQFQKPSHILDAKAKLAPPVDKTQPTEMIIAIHPVPARAAWRVGHQSDFLVITDGFDIAAGAF